MLIYALQLLLLFIGLVAVTYVALVGAFVGALFLEWRYC